MSEFVSITEDFLVSNSYRSSLGRSLKRLPLSVGALPFVVADADGWFGQSQLACSALGGDTCSFRFKSVASLHGKLQRALQQSRSFQSCFNDLLSFRYCLPEYPDSFPPAFRVVDLREGKSVDDGYRAIHLYFQRDNYSYPIEIQLWCGKDVDFNTWSHKYLYTLNPLPELSAYLRKSYDTGWIASQSDFELVLQQYRRDSWQTNYFK